MSPQKTRDARSVAFVRFAQTKDSARRPVSRVLSRTRYPRKDRPLGGSHSSRPAIARRLEQPTRASRDETSLPSAWREAPIWPCSGWGLPCERCCQHPGALLPRPFTLTFRVLRQAQDERRAVCSLWHFPSGCPGRALPATLVSWSPDFPRQKAAAAQPPGARYLARPWSRSKSSWNRIARTCPSTWPSIFSGRQRRWNASTALCPSVMS